MNSALGDRVAPEKPVSRPVFPLVHFPSHAQPRGANMDEETKNDLVDAAKRGLGVSYNFSDVQFSILIGIHQTYLNWDDELIGSFSEAGLKKAEEATKKYKLALRDCGLIGDILAPRVVERAFELIHFFNKTIEDEKEYCQKLGYEKQLFPKTWKPWKPQAKILHISNGRLV